MSNSERSYSEREAAEIVRRASELQSKVAEASPKGMSQAELHRLAGELGIEPRFIDQAIIEGAEPAKSSLGLVSRQERVFVGEPDFEQLGEMAILGGQWNSSRHGFTNQVGNIFVCSLRRGMGMYNVTVRRSPGQTAIAVRSTATLPAVLGFFLSFYGLMAVLATCEELKLFPTVWVPLVAVVILMAVVWLPIRFMVRKCHQRIGEILSEYATAVKEVPVTPSVNANVPSETAVQVSTS